MSLNKKENLNPKTNNKEIDKQGQKVVYKNVIQGCGASLYKANFVFVQGKCRLC